LASQHIHEYDLTSLLPSPRYCVSCAERVCSAIAALRGVAAATCDPESGALTVTREGTALSARELDAAVRRIVAEEVDTVAHAAYRLTALD
jgi:copper chaperone CopZ